MANLKTPLRYPGGKSRAIKKLESFMPDLSQYEEWREPFLGGGSMSIAMTRKYPHLKVTVNDLYFPLYNFWKYLQESPNQMIIELISYRQKYDTVDKCKELFLHAKGEVNRSDCSEFHRAVYFYILNRCAFSGIITNPGFSKQASEQCFNLNIIHKLLGLSEVIKDWTITNDSYETLLDNNKKALVYLDPPYEIASNLYGNKGDLHKNFNHDTFASNCRGWTCSQLISYNDSDKIVDRFPQYNSDVFPLTYTMGKAGKYNKEQKDRKELVLYNYDT